MAQTSIFQNAAWLLAHPEFDEMPATIEEFLGDGYLEIADGIRPGVKEALIAIFGKKIDPTRIAIVERAIFTGAIGVGKSTLASIALSTKVDTNLSRTTVEEFFNLSLTWAKISFSMNLSFFILISAIVLKY